MSILVDGIIKATLGSIGCLANTALIGIILRKRNKNAFEVTLASLGVADLLTSIMIICFGTSKIGGKPLFLFLWAGGYTTQVLSFLHLLFIALQRLCAVFFPLKFKVLFTVNRCVKSLGIFWILSAILATLLATVIKPNNSTMSITIFVFGCILIALHIAICYKIYRPSSLPLRNSLQDSNRALNWRAMIISITVSLAFLVCTFPYAISKFHPFGTMGNIASDVLFASNAILDPMLYFFVSYYKKSNNAIIQPQQENRARAQGEQMRCPMAENGLRTEDQGQDPDFG